MVGEKTAIRNKLESRIEELRKYFTKEIESIIKNQSEIKITTTEGETKMAA